MTVDRIRRLDAATTTYDEFAEVMMANEPAVLYNFAWLLPSFEAWQIRGQADVSFLRREFGDMTVPVVECSSNDYGEQRRTSESLSDYLDTVVRDGTHTATATDQGEDEDEGKSQDNSSHDRDQVDGKPLLYLKDWHFQRLRGERGAAVAAKLETAFFFADDWLNWWWDRQGTDDYRFVYMGPPGSWTPLHHDVLNSWSFNVCGRKHWTLFAPEVTPQLYDRYGRDLATDVRRGRVDAEKFPQLEEAPRLEVEQEPGEAVFVPSGWHHQVVNTGDGITISVNTNWFNGFNLRKVHIFLLSELHAVRAALEHLREDMSGGGVGDGDEEDGRQWERQCEVIMRANSALNMTDFAKLVMERARYLLQLLQRHENADAGKEDDDDDETSLIVTTDSGAALSTSTSADGGVHVAGDSSGDTRWRVLALEQAQGVLRDLAAEPCASHLFLEAERASDGRAEDSAKEDEVDRTAGGDGADLYVLREVLASIESYFRGRTAVHV